jgi:penicillin-binding protein 2
MKVQIDSEGYQPRKEGLLFLQCVVGLFFCLFVIRFWYLQIHKGEDYMRQSRENRLRSELEYATRGGVLDINGKLLAENRTAFGLVLIREDCRDVPATLAQVSEWTGVPLERLAARFQQDSQRGKPFEPILLLSDLSFDKVVRMEARLLFWPGLQIVTHSKRAYPDADIFAHILGYVAEANAKELEADPSLSMRDVIGKQGVEYVLDQRLRGRKGLYSVEVDVLGRVLGRTRIEEPQSGESVKLNIDARLQQAIADILGEQAGSVVVMEPDTGAIQALVTMPSYNNTLFIGGLPQRDWDALRDNPRHPLQNRAIQSVYPPGSVWKLMMAGMLLNKGASPKQRVLCTGQVTLGDQIFRCWRKGGHGYMDLEASIINSCDVYYYTMGEKYGIDNIEAFAKACGFGAPTGIELPHEKSGLVPSRDWKRRRFGERWQRGETLNVSIGQGYTLATPLQVACFVSALLNGGRLMEPHLVAETSPKVRGTIPLSSAQRKFLVDAMRATVETPGGTAGVLRREGAVIGGKTGTAQVVRLRMRGDRRLRTSEMEYHERDHAWIASWGQRHGRSVVVVAMIEHGGGGAAVAGPVVKKVYNAYYELEDARPESSPPPPIEGLSASLQAPPPGGDRHD